MLIAFGRFWSWWTESGSAPGGTRRARVQHVAMALAFGALAVIAGLTSEPLVAAVAGVAAAVSAALALLVPRLAQATRDAGVRSAGAGKRERR